MVNGDIDNAEAFKLKDVVFLFICNETVVAFQKFQMYRCEQLPVNGYEQNIEEEQIC